MRPWPTRPRKSVIIDDFHGLGTLKGPRDPESGHRALTFRYSAPSEAGIGPGEDDNCGICTKIANTSRYGLRTRAPVLALFIPRQRVLPATSGHRRRKPIFSLAVGQ